MTHGERSLRRGGALWAALAPAKRELAGQVSAQLALGGDAPATLLALVDAFAEVSLLRRSLFVRMAELGGPTTTKGRARALFAAYLSALDREQRLAVTLGLERRSRPVDPMAALHRAVEEANR